MSSQLQSRIQKLADRFYGEAVAFRHKLHRIPELAGNEYKTSALIREQLATLPLTVQRPFLETDVVALLNPESDGPNVTLRADIDALPITEEVTSDHASTHPGMMHACGHDGHIAMLYGAIRILCELHKELRGSVRFVFQPGEEIRAMAKDLLDAGAVDKPKMDFCAAIHGWPNVPRNGISTRTGAVMAAAGFFKVTIIGKGGHGSMPSRALNPIIAASRIVEALRNECPPDCVCTVCHINGGNNSNIIPDHALLEGTVRFLEPAAGVVLEKVFRQVVERICNEEQVRYDLNYNVTYPVTASSSEGADLARRVTEEYLGPDRFVPMAESSMSSEDFAFFLQKSSGVFCHLGLGEYEPLHSPRFEFDDAVLKTGMLFLAGTAAEYLNGR